MDNHLIWDKFNSNASSEKFDVVKNNLLGSYDASGNYVFSPRVVNQLTMAQKQKTGAHAGSVFCSANVLGRSDIKFEIAFSKNTENNTITADLYIVESIYDYFEKTLKTKIATLSDTISEEFITKSLSFFNIIDTVGNDEDGRKLADEEIAKLILARGAFANSLEKLNDKNGEYFYERYYNQRLDVLKNMGNPYTLAALEHFYSEFKKAEPLLLNSKKDKTYYKKLNELLDNSLKTTKDINKNFDKAEIEYLKIENVAIKAITAEIANKQTPTTKAEESASPKATTVKESSGAPPKPKAVQGKAATASGASKAEAKKDAPKPKDQKTSAGTVSGVNSATAIARSATPIAVLKQDSIAQNSFATRAVLNASNKHKSSLSTAEVISKAKEKAQESLSQLNLQKSESKKPFTFGTTLMLVRGESSVKAKIKENSKNTKDTIVNKDSTQEILQPQVYIHANDENEFSR